MTGPLKKLGPQPTGATGYVIIRFPHPSSGKMAEEIQRVETLEEAQTICSAPESSFHEGPEENWWFLGYAEASSKTSTYTLW